MKVYGTEMKGMFDKRKPKSRGPWPVLPSDRKSSYTYWSSRPSDIDIRKGI